MTRLILHIGMNKTGTTYLQHFLAGNRRRLAREGLTYAGWSGPDRCHNYFADLLHRGPHAELDRVLARLARPGRDAVVSSGAMFCWSANRAKRDRDDERLRRVEDDEGAAVRAFTDLASRHFDRLEVIAYLRRQDDALEAQYDQSVKNGTWQGGGIDDIERYLAPTLDYEAILGRWAARIGPENVRVRVYDRQQLIDGDIVQDFLEFLGLPRDRRWQDVGDRATGANVRLPPDLFEYKRLMNRVPMTTAERHELKRAVQQVALQLPDDRSRGYIMDDPSRHALCERLAAGNRRVRLRFFDGVEADLFAPLQSDQGGDRRPPERLSAERLLELHCRVERERRSLAQRRPGAICRLLARARAIFGVQGAAT